MYSLKRIINFEYYLKQEFSGTRYTPKQTLNQTFRFAFRPSRNLNKKSNWTPDSCQSALYVTNHSVFLPLYLFYLLFRVFSFFHNSKLKSKREN